MPEPTVSVTQIGPQSKADVGTDAAWRIAMSSTPPTCLGKGRSGSPPIPTITITGALPLEAIFPTDLRSPAAPAKALWKPKEKERLDSGHAGCGGTIG